MHQWAQPDVTPVDEGHDGNLSTLTVLVMVALTCSVRVRVMVLGRMGTSGGGRVRL